MRKLHPFRRARGAVVVGTVLVSSLVATAGPAYADCDLAEIGRSGIAPSGTSVLVDGSYRICVGDSWLG